MSNPYIEVEATRDDDYVTFSRKAAKKCTMLEDDGCALTLFKVNGTMILNEDVTLKGKRDRGHLEGICSS